MQQSQQRRRRQRNTTPGTREAQRAALAKRRRRAWQRRVALRLTALFLVALAIVGTATYGAVCAYRALRRPSHVVAEPIGQREVNVMLDTGVNAVEKACADNPTLGPALEAHSLVWSLSNEQLVAQLFIVTPESLVAERYDGVVTGAGEATRASLLERPVGGIIYFQKNLLSAEQTTAMLEGTQSFALEACGIPLLISVDEEGGSVSRVGGNPGFAVNNVGDMREVGASSNLDYAEHVGLVMGGYLHDLGFTADFAPVADIANNPKSNTMALRSFGSDAQLVAEMVSAQVKALLSKNVLCCAKHFPGIGGAEGDSHDESIYSYETVDEMAQEELVPFQAAIEAGVPMIMVGHLSCPHVTGDDTPASLSPTVMQQVLRKRLGFEGVIVTDSLSMGAVTNRFSPDRAAVEAFLAGADALLMPQDFNAAYQGVLDAVNTGEISQERLRESAYRIVHMKLLNTYGA